MQIVGLMITIQILEASRVVEHRPSLHSFCIYGVDLVKLELLDHTVIISESLTTKELTNIIVKKYQFFK